MVIAFYYLSQEKQKNYDMQNSAKTVQNIFLATTNFKLIIFLRTEYRPDIERPQAAKLCFYQIDMFYIIDDDTRMIILVGVNHCSKICGKKNAESRQSLYFRSHGSSCLPSKMGFD